MRSTQRVLKRHLDDVQVEIAPKSDEDARHGETYGAATTYDARLQEGSEKALDNDGEVVTSTSQVVIPQDVSVGHDDQVTLPDGSTPEIIEIRKPRDHKGNVVATVLMLR